MGQGGGGGEFQYPRVSECLLNVVVCCAALSEVFFFEHFYCRLLLVSWPPFHFLGGPSGDLLPPPPRAMYALREAEREFFLLWGV